MNSGYVTIVLFLLFRNAQLETSCPHGWLKFDKSCYRLTERSNLKFEEAYNSCRQMGGTLATIKSADEQAFIANNLGSQLPIVNENRAYIGGIRINNMKGSEAFRWMDGNKFEYSTWQP